MTGDRRLRVHIKNNHAGAHTFPSTPESEAVFTITRERYEAVARRHPDVAAQLDVFIDWDEENFRSSMATAEILLCWDLPKAGLREVAPRLKVIHVTGAGVEHLWPLDWLPPGVTLVNSKGVHSAKAGEYGLMAVLMAHSHMPEIVSNQRDGRWVSLFATPIAGRTVLIIGLGSIGAAVAARLRPLEVEILGISRHGKPVPNVDRVGSIAELDDFLPLADIVLVATPLTPETRNLLDARRLRLMRRGSSLINVGRGAVVDYEALVALMRSGAIASAILDVFEQEPLPAQSPLWHEPNLILTPHVSSDDAETYVELTLELFFDNMRRLLAGDELRNVVRTDLGY